MPDLSPYQRESARRALSYLAEVLGEDMWATPHPFGGHLRNLAPWSRLAFTRWARDLESLEGSERIETLYGRLRNPNKWSEGMSVLRAAARLRAQDFAVGFDPKVTVYTGPKEPDLVISNAELGDRIFVEVAELGPSMAEQEARQAFEAVTQEFWGEYRVDFSGRMLRTPSKQALDQILRKIRDAKARALATKKLQLVSVPNLIDLALAPSEDQEHLRNWMAESKMQGFSGPSTASDTIKRILGKIRNEQGQLPRDELGALILDVPLGFFWEEDSAAISEHLRELGENVAGYPHLLSVVLTSEFMNIQTKAEIIQVEGQVFARHAQRSPFAEEVHLVTNRYCKLKLAPATITAWNRAFLP